MVSITNGRAHICDLCGGNFPDQYKFFEHLKFHYEIVTSPEITPSPSTTTSGRIASNMNLLSSPTLQPPSIPQIISELPEGSTSTITIQWKKKGYVSTSQISSALEDVSRGILHQTSQPIPSISKTQIQPESQLSNRNRVINADTPLSRPLNNDCIRCKKQFKKRKNLESHTKGCESRPRSSNGTYTSGKISQIVPSNEVSSFIGFSNSEMSLLNEVVGDDFIHDDDINDDNTEGVEDFLEIYSCSNCNAEFTSQQSLDDHTLQQHLKKTQALLDKGNNVSGDHVESKPIESSGDKTGTSSDNNNVKEKISHQCKVCERIFSHRNSLVYHMRKHTGERPYKCGICEKRFFAASALQVHTRCHSGEKPYICEICKRPFRQWADLSYHKISIHTEELGFQCHFCGKKFARKYSLTIHVRIHTNERNYVCELCNKSFRAASYLKNHKRIHTGEKPHSCPICQKAFRVKSDMRRHVESHKKIKIARIIGSVAVEGLSDTPELIPVVTCDPKSNLERDMMPLINGTKSLAELLSNTNEPNGTLPEVIVGDNNKSLTLSFDESMGMHGGNLSTLQNTVSVPLMDGNVDFMGNGMTAAYQETMTLYQGPPTNLEDLINTEGTMSCSSVNNDNTIVLLYS